jgi:NitT/TauT family transport system substrate-binding protein
MIQKTILATAAMLLALGGAARAEPTTIKVGWVVLTSSAVPLALEKPELLQHQGQSYTIEPVLIRSTSAMVTALATGDVDVGTLAYSTLAFAVLNAKLDDLRVIAGIMEDGTGNAATGHFMVLKDGPVRTIKDLKGKVIASLAAGSAVDIAIRAMLRKNGLDDKKDVTIVEAQFSNMKAMLMSHRADLIAISVPYNFDPEVVNTATDLFTQKEAMGGSQLLVWGAREPFAMAHRAAMVDFLEDSLRVTRYLTDPAHHDEVVRIVAKGMKQPPEYFADWLFTPRDFYRAPDGMPNLPVLQANIDLEHDLGFIDKTIKVGDYTDLSYVKEANARLK